MTAETPLDRAWETANTELAGDAEMARFYDIFAATELFLLIDPDTLADGKTPKPLTFPVEGGETALVFDTEARLASFHGRWRCAPHHVWPGRDLDVQRH